MAEFAQILIRAKDETKTAFDSAARNMRGLESSAAKLSGVLGTIGIGAGLSVAGFAAFAKSSIDAADGLNDMSQRLGVSVKDLASFKLAAEQSGTSLDGIGTGIARLTRSIGEAEGGNKKLAGALQGLGITARDPKEAFFQLADAVQRIQDPAKRASLLSQVLGKSYQELVPLLNQGGDALRESARQSETFSEAMARLAPDADKFNDQLATLKINAAGAAAGGLVPLVKGLNEVFDRIKLVKDLIGAGGLFNTIAITAGTGEISTVMRRLKDDIKETQAAIEGEKAKGKDASPFEEKLRGFNAQLEVMKKNSRDAALALGEQFKNYKVPQAPSEPGKPKPPTGADPQAAFIARLRDEASTLGFNSEALKRYEAIKLKLTGTNARLAEGYITQIAAFKDQQTAAEANNALADEEIKKREAIEAAQNNSIKSVREWIAEQEFEASLFGKTNAEREAAIQLRALEANGIDTQTESFKKLREQLVAISETRALDSLISDTTIEKTRSLYEKVSILDRALLDGKISTEQWNEAFEKFNGGKKIEELDTFAKKFAHNAQDTFADFFKNFDQGTDGMLKKFGETVKGLIANAVAADLTKKLFGGLADNGATSGSGWAGSALNWIGDLLKFDGGGYTGDGARAGGIDGKGGFLAVMHPRETVVDHTRGQSVGGGNTYVVHVHGSNNAQDVRRAAGQGMREAVGMFEGARRYV